MAADAERRDPYKNPAVENILAPIEAELGVERGFFVSLGQESDWSFLIKAGALCDAAVGRAIEAKLNANIGKFIATLPVDGRSSKIELADQLGILSGPEVRFIKLLGTLRNRAAHRIRDVNFDLVKWVAELPADKLREFAFDAQAQAIKDGPLSEEDKAFALASPKFLIWLGAMTVLVGTNAHVELAVKLREAVASTFPAGPLALMQLFRTTVANGVQPVNALAPAKAKP